MNKLLDKFKPLDVIAIITIIGGLILKFCGFDGTVGMILTTIVVFYFGKRGAYDVIKEKNISFPKTKTVEEIIKTIAEEEGVDSDLAIKVAKCESGLNPSAKNINSSGSIDRGLFQWNDRWHPEITDEIAFDVEKSTRAFCQAYKNGHMSWWNATKTCWEK